MSSLVTSNRKHIMRQLAALGPAVPAHHFLVRQYSLIYSLIFIRYTLYTPQSMDGSAHTEIRAYGATRLYKHSHELPALTALAQHISHSHSGNDEKRPTEKCVELYLELSLLVTENLFLQPLAALGPAAYMLNTRSKEKKTGFYSCLTCFVNTPTLNMYGFLS